MQLQNKQIREEYDFQTRRGVYCLFHCFILSELLSCWKPQELIFELYIDGVNNPMHCYVHFGGTHPSYQTSHPLEIISSEDGQSNTDLKNKFQR